MHTGDVNRVVRRRGTVWYLICGTALLLTACALAPVAAPATTEELVASQTSLPLEAMVLLSTETLSPTSTFTEAATPTLHLTDTPTPPTATATVVIDFPIPDAPAGVDAELWRTAYIDLMITRPISRAAVTEGRLRPSWDNPLDTIVWTMENDIIYAYNREFGFTGELVSDTFGRTWIVRYKLAHSQSDCSSIWDFNQLHVAGESELIMGVQALPLSGVESTGESVALVGQVVGQGQIDLEPYLLPGFDGLSEHDAGIFFGRQNLVFHSFVVRFPTREGYVELNMPLCPEAYCDDPHLFVMLGTRNCADISGRTLMNALDEGSMAYFNSDTLMRLVEGLTPEMLQELRADPDYAPGMSISTAFGTGEHLQSIMGEYFGINLAGGYLPVDIFGAPLLLDPTLLTADAIGPPIGGVLFISH